MNDVGVLSQVPASKVRSGNNDRKEFDVVKLRELADSIAAHGLAQPPTVRPVGDIYEIVAGERRFRAMTQMLKWETIPVVIRELSDEEASAVMLLENTARADLDPMEEAEAYASRMEIHGWTVAEVAAKAGVSTDRVRSRLALRNLSPDIKHLVARGQMPLQHAELLGQQTTTVQKQAIRIWMAKQNINLSELREIINQLVAVESQPVMFMVAQELEQKLASNPKPIIGKDAQVPIVEHDDVPDFEVSSKESVGEACDRYMRQLASQGLIREAAAVGKLYRALVRGRKTFAAGNVLERAERMKNEGQKEGASQKLAKVAKAR